MRLAAFRIIRDHPAEYVAHVLQHIYYEATRHSGQWTYNWYGSDLAAAYSTTEPATLQLERTIKTHGLVDRVPRAIQEAANDQPFMFDLTGVIFPQWFASVLFLVCVVTTVPLGLVILFRRVGFQVYFAFVTGAATLGFLTMSAMACPLIPRQLLVSDGMLLVNFVALANWVVSWVYMARGYLKRRATPVGSELPSTA
jgi:hypothetical protein